MSAIVGGRMAFLSNYAVQILLLLIIILCFSLFVIKTSKIKEKFDVMPNSENMEGTDLSTDGSASHGGYDPELLEQVNTNAVKYVADMLISQQWTRVNWLRTLKIKVNEAKARVKAAEIGLAVVIASIAFTASTMASFDPFVVTRAIAFDAVLTTVDLVMASKELDDSKKALKKAEEELQKAKDLVGYSANKEFMEQEVKMYSGNETKAECDKIVPTPGPGSEGAAGEATGTEAAPASE